MKLAALIFSFLIGSAGVRTENIEGEWHGALEIKDDAPLRLALHVQATAGGFKATVGSIDEGGAGLPVDAFDVQGSTVKFAMKAVGGFYQGTLAKDALSMDGLWRQNGLTLPLKWERGPDPANLLEPISKTEALEKGRLCARLFYDGELSQFWSRLSPVAQQEFVSQTKLGGLRDELENRFGWRTETIRESVRPAGLLQIYCLLEKFDHSPDAVELQLALNPTGQIAQFIVPGIQR